MLSLFEHLDKVLNFVFPNLLILYFCAFQLGFYSDYVSFYWDNHRVKIFEVSGDCLYMVSFAEVRVA